VGADKQTIDDRRSTEQGSFVVPGIVVVYSSGHPLFQFVVLRDGTRRLGRDEKLGVADDARMSREHAELAWDGHFWTLRDLRSRNGTFVDGERVGEHAFLGSPKVIRMGQTLVLPLEDGSDALTLPLVDDNGVVAGPKLRKSLRDIKRAAEAGQNLLLSGETGSGKELGAQAFHRAGTHRKGPLVSVNCATIPHGLAERILFGAKRGAFSGAAADSEGYVQSAEGGVLFLDECGELELEVQAKLLRVLETREVTPLGATSARRVDVGFCFATHRDLREAVAREKFRADLFYRISQPEVNLPPLRQRLEEIPWHVAAEVARAAPAVRLSAELLEACMLRPWPGNVRELLAEIRRAACALAATSLRTLRPEHLLPNAGMPAAVLREGATAGASPQMPTSNRAETIPQPPRSRDPRRITEEEIRAAMTRHHGMKENVWRDLGLQSRFALHRLLKKYGIGGE
jgi:transcriptional regulator with GAF, ATPase, and Fis domain